MPWISPPSRFLGAKGATRPRPLLGGFELVAGGVRRRHDPVLRQPRRRDGRGDRRCRAAPLTDASEPLPGRPSDYFRKFFNDSMVNGSAAAVRCGLAFFGAERVMYGTDFPMGSNNGEDWPVEVLDTIRSPGLNAAGQELLLGANLRRIMRL